MAEYTDHLYCDIFPYITPTELIERCAAAGDFAEDDDQLLEAIEDASTVMFYLTGKQFAGSCQATVRPPCGAGCTCGCNRYQVNLGLWPVTDLVSVRHEGVTYTGTDLTDTFHVNEWRFLARNDGEYLRPGNQWAASESSYDTADDGYVFEVTFNHGIKIPNLMKRATRALACEWMSQIEGQEGPCKLPQRTTSVIRSGISMDISSAVDMLKERRTGIYEVDLAIMTFNPSGLQSPSFVWSGQSSYRGSRIGTDPVIVP